MKTNALFTTRAHVGTLTASVFAAALALAAPSSVFAQSAGASHHQSMPSSASDGSMKMHMVMQESHNKMNGMEMSGDTDRDFAMMMRAHHQAGIDMAKAELASGKDAAMLAEARKIIASQQKDIEKFDAWLQKQPKK